MTKARGSFPNDEAVFKRLYVALRNIAEKWTMSMPDWKAALNRFAIVYENRLPLNSPTEEMKLPGKSGMERPLLLVNKSG